MIYSPGFGGRARKTLSCEVIQRRPVFFSELVVPAGAPPAPLFGNRLFGPWRQSLFGCWGCGGRIGHRSISSQAHRRGPYRVNKGGIAPGGWNTGPRAHPLNRPFEYFFRLGPLARKYDAWGPDGNVVRAPCSELETLRRSEGGPGVFGAGLFADFSWEGPSPGPDKVENTGKKQFWIVPQVVPAPKPGRSCWKQGLKVWESWRDLVFFWGAPEEVSEAQ